MKAKSLLNNKGKKFTSIRKITPTRICTSRIGLLPWWQTPCWYFHKWRWQCLVWKTVELFSILSCIWISFFFFFWELQRHPPQFCSLWISPLLFCSAMHATKELPNKSQLQYKENSFSACPFPAHVYTTHRNHPLCTLSASGNVFYPPVFRCNSSKILLQLEPYIWCQPRVFLILPSTLC